MKLKWFFIAGLLAFWSSDVLAQQDSAQNQNMATEESTSISDEDLRKYAVTMDSINDMKRSLLGELSAMVKNNESITNARYNELSRIVDDEEKLKEAKATPEEINFVKEVQRKKDEGAAEISEVFQTMARDYVGVEAYNQIKNALASDNSIKARYESIMKEVDDDNKK